MRIREVCFDCLLTRIEYECRLVLDCSIPENEKRVKDVVNLCRDELKRGLSEAVPSPELSSRVHRLACQKIEHNDPYVEIKEKTNTEAEKLLAEVGGSLKTFRDCALAAVIGNTLDFGSKEHVVTDDFTGFFKEEFQKGFSVDDCDKIEKLTERTVFICDNCGEIVFDRKLVEYLKKKGSHVTVVVKGAPIINDATMSDALKLGMDKVADAVLTSTDGIPEVGFNVHMISDELKDEISKATLIISKGMANYESLSEYKKIMKLPPVAYLMMVKCVPISEDIGIEKGSRIAYLSE